MNPVLPLLGFHLYQRQRLVSVPILSPLLICVEEGQKQLLTGHHTLRAEAGQWLVIPGGQTLDIINQPSSHGRYRAWSLGQPRDWLQRLLLQYGPQLPPLPWPGNQTCFTPDDASRHALQQLIALRDEEREGRLLAARAEHAWQGLMLALASAGLGAGLFHLPRQDCRAQVLSLLSFDPARHWQAQDIASGLAMSSATLRRRLAACDTSFSQLLAEVRMERALLLLNSQPQPIAHIAAACGYQSPSRFAAAFRQRFGISPAALRNMSADGAPLRDHGAGHPR